MVGGDINRSTNLKTTLFTTDIVTVHTVSTLHSKLCIPATQTSAELCAGSHDCCCKVMSCQTKTASSHPGVVLSALTASPELPPLSESLHTVQRKLNVTSRNTRGV